MDKIAFQKEKELVDDTWNAQNITFPGFAKCLLSVSGKNVRHFRNGNISKTVRLMYDFFHLSNLKTVEDNIYHRFFLFGIISLGLYDGDTARKGIGQNFTYFFRAASYNSGGFGKVIAF